MTGRRRPPAGRPRLGIDSLFALMACGLVSYGMVMVAVMRRELGLRPRSGGEQCVSCCSGFVSPWPAVPGCPRRRRRAAPTPVTVSYPVERDVTDYADFTARTAAVDSVEVRARVWGYLDKVNFKEGALVKKGDVLFEIDPRTYQADAEPGRGRRSRQDEARVHAD